MARIIGDYPIDEDRVRTRAYELWEEEGHPEGRHDEHWLRARAEIEREFQARTAEAGRHRDTAMPDELERAFDAEGSIDHASDSDVKWGQGSGDRGASA